MDLVFTFPNERNNDDETIKGSEWDERVDYVASAWADHAIRWIEQTRNGTVLFYEKLKGTLAYEELDRLLRDLHLQPVDYIRMQCAVTYRDRNTNLKQGSKLRQAPQS